MRSFKSLSQVVACSSLYNVYLKIEVVAEHLFEREYLRLVVYEGKHYYAHRILKLCESKELIENYLRRSVLFQLDNYSHAVLVGLIAQVVDTLDTLILAKLVDVLENEGLVYHVGYLVHDNTVSALYLLKVSAAPESYLSASCSVGCAYASSAHDDSACREVRTLYMLHELLHSAVRILYKQSESVYDLAKVVGWYVGSHSDSDAYRAVYEQIRES